MYLETCNKFYIYIWHQHISAQTRIDLTEAVPTNTHTSQQCHQPASLTLVPNPPVKQDTTLGSAGHKHVPGCLPRVPVTDSEVRGWGRVGPNVLGSLSCHKFWHNSDITHWDLQTNYRPPYINLISIHLHYHSPPSTPRDVARGSAAPM